MTVSVLRNGYARVSKYHLKHSRICPPLIASDAKVCRESCGVKRVPNGTYPKEVAHSQDAWITTRNSAISSAREVPTSTQDYCKNG